MVLTRRRRRDESGAVAIVFAIAMASFLMLVAALVVDLGVARDTKAASQDAADASSLAAANSLYLNGPLPDFTRAVAAAKSYSLANYGVEAGAWSTCTDTAPLAYRPDPTTSCISFDNATRPSRVRVAVPLRQVATPFAGGAGVPIQSTARTNIVALPSQPCGLCVLGSGITHQFQNGDATVRGADIYINGSSNVGSNGLVASNGQIFIEGTASGGLDKYDPDPTTSVPPIPDPLANLVLPPDMTGLVPRTDPCTQGPGIYAGWAVSGSTCTLSPGLYVVRSGIVDLSGNSNTVLRGTGVTIYLTCANGTLAAACPVGATNGARLDASGSGTLQLTAPTSGPLAGVTIVADRNSQDPSSNTPLIRLTGNGGSGFSGAIYAKSATLQMNGNGCSSSYDSMIVVNDIAFNGANSCLVLDYDVNHNPPPPLGILNLDE